MAARQKLRTVEEWEADVGRQVRTLRLRANRTQRDVADAANISVSALSLLERGRGTSLASLVAVVRALGRSDWLDELAPPETVSPMERLRQRHAAASDTRKRASGQSASFGSQRSER